MVSSVTRVASVTVHLVMLLVAFAIAQLVKCYHPVPIVRTSACLSSFYPRKNGILLILLN